MSRSAIAPQKAIANAQEAIASYLEFCQEDSITPPSPSSVAAILCE
ncbi:hypothetical protein PJF56_14170 [Roseofilum sp. BLCC_M91]|uniref:Type II toxin-antitoxin system HicB family antitoxin n=1 Tax=Roseofilum halophilum BLCC-M91 TaxID=3022259 RepID=A0ABT7BLD7_9CYAN|nr:hypothetical protein [Roseofilum halophilum]MDJ1180011.1 hypothetical protein [Roseofilum halophilum BLCC-M91]